MTKITVRYSDDFKSAKISSRKFENTIDGLDSSITVSSYWAIFEEIFANRKKYGVTKASFFNYNKTNYNELDQLFDLQSSFMNGENWIVFDFLTDMNGCGTLGRYRCDGEEFVRYVPIPIERGGESK